MTRYVCAIVLSLALLTTTNARAQDAAQIELAKRHFELGKTYYSQAAYRRALEAFQESHRLSGKAALLFNIGKCHEALGELGEAIASYRQYLGSTGKSDANIEARIKNLERRLEAQRATVAQSQPARVEPTDAAARPTPTAPTDRPVSGQRLDWMTLSGWSLVGLGAAAVAAGIAMGVLAKKRASEVEDAYRAGIHDWADIKSTEEEGKRFDIGMIVGLTLGIAAAGGGATLLYFSHRSERKISRRTLSLTPMIHGDAVGFAAALRY